MATAKKTSRKATPAAPPKAPNRTRTEQINARLSTDEKADLDAVIQAWEEQAAAQGFAGEGFADWLRAVIRREKAALEAKGGKPARKPKA
jgi:hypothetical protein